MHIGQRIKELRKSLDMTQDEFGLRLGVARNSIANYEIGRRDPMEQTIKSICREFNVNNSWLTGGLGEMFAEVDQQAVDLIDRIMSGESEFAKRVFKAFAALDESEWKVLEKLIDNISDKSEKKPTH